MLNNTTSITYNMETSEVILNLKSKIVVNKILTDKVVVGYGWDKFMEILNKWEKRK